MLATKKQITEQLNYFITSKKSGFLKVGTCGTSSILSDYVYPCTHLIGDSGGNTIRIAIEQEGKLIYNYQAYILFGKKGKEYMEFKTVSGAVNYIAKKAGI